MIQENDIPEKSNFSANSQNPSESASNKSSDENIPEINSDFNLFECASCGYIYDPVEGLAKYKISKGTPFRNIDPNSFRCPVCRVGSGLYKDIGPKSKPSGFEENLEYGFGFNNLPSGQKNVLIFGSFAFAAALILSLYSLH